MLENRQFKRDILLIFISDMFFNFGYSLYINFLPIRIRELGGNDFTVSLIYSVPSFIGILAIISGILNDKVGRKNMIIFGWAITIPAPLIWIFADNWQWLLVGQVFFSMTYFCVTAITLYIFDYKAPGNKMQAFSLIFIGGTTASIIAPYIGGKIIKAYGMQTLFLIVFLIFTFSSLIIIFISKQENDSKSKHGGCLSFAGIKGSCPVKKLMLLILFLSLPTFIQNIGEPYLPLYLDEFKHISLDLIGLAFTILFIGSSLFTWFFNKSDERINMRTSLLAGASLFVASVLLLLAAKSTAVLFTSLFFRGLNRSMLVFIQGFFAKRLTGENKDVILSIFISARSVLLTLAPYPGAFLYRMHPSYPFYAEGILLVLWMAFSFHRSFRNCLKESG